MIGNSLCVLVWYARSYTAGPEESSLGVKINKETYPLKVRESGPLASIFLLIWLRADISACSSLLSLAVAFRSPWLELASMVHLLRMELII
jgi:hypothetical protein